ncbi:hypothetical protein PG994_006843 [Apiospora phragmitis]|uniref:Aquaporin n=1 Tax=Apiospora phragmitis TaxID=2905665 RepID=A0ABR1VGF2_9PEZI
MSSGILPNSNAGHKRLPERPAQSPWKQHFVATLGEFVGTFQFLFFGNTIHLMVINLAAQAPGSTSKLLQVVYIGYGYGFSLLVNVWAFYRISGGLFNPAVRFVMSLSPYSPFYASSITHPHFPRYSYVPLTKLSNHARTVPSRQAPLAPPRLLRPHPTHSRRPGRRPVPGHVPRRLLGTITTVAPGVSVVQGLFGEMFLTAFLMFTILMLAGEKSRTSFVAPVGIGLALFVAQLAGVFFTGGSLNPARSLGSSAAAADFPSYHWIYWLGPGMGAILAAAFFRLLKGLNYEEANPGQDAKCEV